MIPHAFKPKQPELPNKDFECNLIREPVGVVGCITPWNFPLLQAINKVAPALAAGCAVVLKPSPLASVTCVMLGELAKKAGIPSGFLNILTGGPPGENTGQFLIDHPLLDKLSFTGSSLTGKKCLSASVEHLRPTTLELGGKSAMIVFEDADIDSTIDWALLGIFLNSGQVCCATSRMLLHESIYDRFLEKLKAKAEGIKEGDPLAKDTQMGAIVSQAQYEKVKSFIATAKEKKSGNLLTGGEEFPQTVPSELSKGYFIKPTIFTNVDQNSEIWTQEVFGPVLSVVPFKTEKEAVLMANATSYGLGNAVMSSDKERCRRVAGELRSGVVWENASQPLYPQTPFGGQKKSGFGREMGESGLEEYIHTKTVVSTATPGFSWKYYG
jgi:betaine-aldehyde dehydrogenase